MSSSISVAGIAFVSVLTGLMLGMMLMGTAADHDAKAFRESLAKQHRAEYIATEDGKAILVWTSDHMPVNAP